MHGSVTQTNAIVGEILIFARPADFWKSWINNFLINPIFQDFSKIRETETHLIHTLKKLNLANQPHLLYLKPDIIKTFMVKNSFR